MRPEDFFNQFTEQLKSFAPNAAAITDEMRQHFKSATLATFEKLDLVTKEEFDAQQAVLIRTREKLEALEKEVAELEQRVSS